MKECTCCVCHHKFALSQGSLKIYEAEGRQVCVHEGSCEKAYKSQNPSAKFVKLARAANGRVELTDLVSIPATARATQAIQ